MEVLPATSAYIPRIIEIQFSAFENDPYQEALFPGDQNSPSVRQGAIERTEKYWDADPTARWQVCIDSKTNNVLGFALWNVYDHERPESEWKKQPEVDWCEGRKKEIATNFLSVNAGLRQRIWGGKPYVLLNLLCIHQDFQRRGAGTLLVKRGMEIADELGLAVHLEASPAGFGLYRKLGFRQVEVGVIKAEDWDGDHDREYIAMVRETKASKSNKN